MTPISRPCAANRRAVLRASAPGESVSSASEVNPPERATVAACDFGPGLQRLPQRFVPEYSHQSRKIPQRPHFTEGIGERHSAR